ncbi:kinase-like domain-containing protein [Rhizophagus clarus]|uniref:Kinase-like domain-containing protein n=1 Tax=Rhizophagus clarus TaxID=94130 RepID=A0A8H3L993_9GLOM|nr:kinase-like domain-containing protein [Rhizophagus clarus]
MSSQSDTVRDNYDDDIKCKICGEVYMNVKNKWCKSCRIDNLKKNFTNWTSGNEKIDNFIQGMQLNIERYDDTIIEWIPYNKFKNIKKMGENGLTTATWKGGKLKYYWKYENERIKKVTLKFLSDSQDLINDISNEVKVYSIRRDGEPKIYGISQNPDTKDYVIVFQKSCNCKNCGKIYTSIKGKWCYSCQVNDLKENFTNWTSGNEKIDAFIQEMQLNIQMYDDTIIEWIPYNRFNKIKEISKGGITTAIWKDGPLKYNHKKKKYKRRANKVTLKFFNNSQNNINEFLNEVNAYSIKSNNEPEVYGISQNQNTKDYIIVLQNGCNCINCGKIYEYIDDKWCNQCRINSLKENFTNWTSGDVKIDGFIQEKQLEIKSHCGIIVEWIPYNQFDKIKEIGKDGLATVYSATWKDGPLYNYDYIKKHKWERLSNYEVNLKFFDNPQNNISEFLNEAESCYGIYGISKHPDTKNYIIVLRDLYCEICGHYTRMNNKWCKPCQISNIKQNPPICTSGNEKIDEFIQEMQQLEITCYFDTIVQWIPYNQFNDIKKTECGFDTAIWKGNLLKYNEKEKKYKRIPNEAVTVTLKFLNDSQDIINDISNEIKAYSLTIYGISQNPDTKDYVIVIRNSDYCKKCGQYTNMTNSCGYLCKPCKINVTKDYIIVLEYANCGSLNNDNNYNKIIKNYNWHEKLMTLKGIVKGLKKIQPFVAPECWDPNPDNRPSANEIDELTGLFLICSYNGDIPYRNRNKEIRRQFEEAEEYRKAKPLFIENNQLTAAHPQAYYTSRLLNPFTKDLPKYENDSNNSMEVTDFTK